VASYRPMTLADLASHLTQAADDRTRWKLVWESCSGHGSRPNFASSVPMPSSGRPPHSGSTACTCRPPTWNRRNPTRQRPSRPGAARTGVHCPGERLVRRGVVADVFGIGGAAMALAYDATLTVQR
jgi:hypothetical protein